MKYAATKNGRMKCVAPKDCRSKPGRANGGFALLEVVIAMFILAIGILGAGALQTVGMQTTQGAYFRSQAMLLAGDILDRMRANRTVASSYVGNTSDISSEAECFKEDKGCAPAALATDDMRQWSAMVKDKTRLPNGVGTITSAGANQYVIEVSWDENEWQTNKYERAVTQKKYELHVALDNN
jgi:type IV pilus assembly protein PilV